MEVYAEGLAGRRARVERALARVDHPGVEPIVPSPRESGSRARVKVRFRDGRAGFHEPGTHTFAEAELAHIARPEIVAEADRIARHVPEAEIRTDGSRTVTVLSRPAVLDGNVAVGNRRVSGEVTLTVAGLRVSPLSFFQVNLEVNERVVADVDMILLRLAPARLLDVYAGVGNLTARAVRRGVPATLIESDRSSAADARFNLPAAEVKVEDAARFVPGSVFFDAAVLDPPRAGAPGLLERLAVTKPRAILYLSCEPTTLARDVGRLKGYRVTLVRPYDMFPGTDHVETLLVLER